MARVLLIYATTEGHTTKIAQAIATQLRMDGHSIQVLSSAELPAKFDGGRFDGVIIGASVHASHYPRQLTEWVKENSSALGTVPGAFFSVCLGILEAKNPKTQEAEWRIIENFYNGTGWKPARTATFAGALLYSKYGWLKRRIMRRIAARAGGDTDTSRDYEYTDWNQVREFSRGFAKSLPTVRQAS